uniref:DnaJ homolog subfamily C member 2 n=1 Tax=Parastrongyloides trichosuri TaxID=131310 RepID=A0A0N4Z3P0_PARTI
MTVSENNLALSLLGFSTVKEKIVEEAGIAYEVNIIRDKLCLKKCTLPVYRQQSIESLDDISGEEEIDHSHLYDEDDENYRRMMLSLEPNDWKNFDHYKVLGLSKLRWRATAGDIKNAYRRKVLIYHPDKSKKSTGLSKKELEIIFGCIQKSYELMGDTIEKRRSYDSIDPEFDEDLPSEKSINSENIFKVLGKVFERNARFSKKPKVPHFGDMSSSREEVERFYDFWLHFESWREFSYLDEEDSSKGEDRYERREIERMNKVKRDKMKKEDSKRYSTLVEMAYNKDPRLVIFKEEDKKKKQEEKERRKKEAERKREEERIRFEAECAEYKRQEAERKRKEEEEKKRLEAEKSKVETAQTISTAWTPEEIELLVKATRLMPPGTSERWKQVSDYINTHKKDKSFVRTTKDVLKYIKEKSSQPTQKAQPKANENEAPINNDAKVEVDEWTKEEQKALETALRTYSAKEDDRWDKIAAAVGTKNKKECVKRYKDLVSRIKAKKAT